MFDLQSELNILIHVGENENIVNILGACTKGEARVSRLSFFRFAVLAGKNI